MAESKSTYFSFEISVHSEKLANFASLSLNRLEADSERAPSWTLSEREPLVACVLADNYLLHRGQVGEGTAWPFKPGA